MTAAKVPVKPQADAKPVRKEAAPKIPVEEQPAKKELKKSGEERTICSRGEWGGGLRDVFENGPLPRSRPLVAPVP